MNCVSPSNYVVAGGNLRDDGRVSLLVCGTVSASPDVNLIDHTVGARSDRNGGRTSSENDIYRLGEGDRREVSERDC